MDLQGAMLVFHYHNVLSPDTYGPADYFSVTAYLEEQPAGVFTMPSNLDVVITLEIPDPLDQSRQRTIFNQTIPAGSVQAGTRYRLTNGPGGLDDLEFSRLTSDTIYMYLDVEGIYLLPDLKKLECWPRCPATLPTNDRELASACAGCYSGTPLTPLQYRVNYILPISSLTITITIGNYSWKGQGNLMPGDYNEHFQHLILVDGR